MIIKKGDKEIELTMDEVSKLANTIVDPPAGDWTGIRVLDQDIDLVPNKKVGGRVPKDGDAFWMIDIDGDIYGSRWTDDEYKRAFFEAGNAFWNKKDAERELKRRKAEYRLKQLDGAIRNPEDLPNNGRVYSVSYSKENKVLCVAHKSSNYVDAGISFFSESQTQSSIKTNRQDWLDYLGVEGEE